MSNSFANLTNAVGVLKNYYSGSIISQFNDEIPFYREIEKSKEKYNGSKVIRPVKVRRNPGVGAVSDGGLLPSIGKQTVIQAEISAKYNYLRFGLTAPMIKASQGDKGSFVSLVEFEMDQGMTDCTQNINRQLFWDGTSDLALVAAAATASQTITASGRTSSEDGSKYLDIGVQIDIYSAAGVLKYASIGITNLSGTTTATLTLDATVTVVANDVIVQAGSFGNEIQGILTTLDGATSTIYAVDRSAYPIFQSNVVSASSGQLNLDLLQQAYNLARRRGNAKIDAIYCDYDSERYYNKLLVADKRFVGKVVGDGTFSDKSKSFLEYAGIPIVPDKDCPLQVLFLDSSHWQKFELCAFEWADETGSNLIAQTSSDSFEARLRMFTNIFCEKPSAQARLHTYVSP